MARMNFKFHYFPALVTGWFALAFLISYIVAVSSGKVYPLLPYISELGIWEPSRCIFGFMLNIGSILAAALLYIRYKQIDFVIKTKTTNLRKKWNEIEFYLGLIFAFGICVVANFPGDMVGNRAILITHMIGAFMSFGIGGIYLLIQTKITFDLQPYYNRYPKLAVSKRVQYFRLFLTIGFGISFVLVFVFAHGYMELLRNSKFDKNNKMNLQKCTPDNPGYTYHLLSAIFEWLLAIIFFSYTLTATNEIQFMSFKEICFENSVNKKKM